MPARDPAASPHNPSFSPTSANHANGHNHGHQHHFGSPASSGYSIHTQLNGVGSPPNPANGDSYARSLFRRVSADKGNSNIGGNGPSTGIGIGHPPVAKSGESSRPRRISVVDNAAGDESTSSAGESTFSLATSSQAIRDSSNRLASFSLTTNRPRALSVSQQEPPPQSPLSSLAPRQSGPGHRPVYPSHLNPAVAKTDLDISPPAPASLTHVGRSGLSVMIERDEQRRRQESSANLADIGSSPDPDGDPDQTPHPRNVRLLSEDFHSEPSGQATPVPYPSSLPGSEVAEPTIVMGNEEDANASSALRRYLAQESSDVERASETSPLLGGNDGKRRGYGLTPRLARLRQRAEKITAMDVVNGIIVEPVKTLPATILGLLLNVLDGVSYGMILFPASPIFQGFGSLGVSMFFVSCIVSQLVFSLGGSIFPGGNGSMMIEAVPFFHILINIIAQEVGDDATAIISTTMISFAFSSILTGAVFFALGAFKLGGLIGYFPRHILVGCIGGVGIFLIETGLEVARGLKEEGFEYNLATLKLFFESTHVILLWTIPLFLAILLRIITHFNHHQLVFPLYFFVIPCVFYVVVLIGGWNLEHLRKTGWIFDVGGDSQAWWTFYTYFDFKKTNWGAFWAAMPTQMALVFFGILHVPLNVPALGVSLSEDNVKLDRELIAHGYSNVLAGLTGTVPNYLTYVNTVLFYRVGGGSRLSGLMLAAATAAVMAVGPVVISYLPVMLVGALIFVLGIDLTIEAVWDTRNRVNRWEYITIWAIAIGMTIWDFVIGLLFGIILACIFFVVQTSRRRAIRTVFNGATAKSTVRRPRSQRAFLQQVGSQTYVMKLQGFLFFGTITTVEDEIRKLLDLAKWAHNPIRFLIMDLTLVHGLDFSAAEAFVRLQRLLAAKDVLFIICGAAPEGITGTALRNVGLWPEEGDERRIEVFVGLNDALEWTENAYLTAFYENQKAEETAATTIDFPKVAKPPFTLAESFANSPRRSHLAKAGGDTLPYTYLPTEPPSPTQIDYIQPLPLLLQTFGPYLEPLHPDRPDLSTLSDASLQFLNRLIPYFTQTIVQANQVLWQQHDPADGLYLIETGSLRATYAFDSHHELIQETMVAGTVAGDLSTLSETRRNATTVAERDCVLWKLDRKALGRLEKEEPETARRFVRIVLKAVAEEQDVLSSHLVAVLS